MPIICKLHVPQTDFTTVANKSHIAWHKLDHFHFQLYESELSNRLLGESCNNDTDPCSRIDSRYNFIVDSIL